MGNENNTVNGLRWVRWHCNECKKVLAFELTKEFKENFFKAAGDFFPYPVIVAHENHFTIIHLDKQFQDRGTITSKIFVDLNKKI